MEVGICDNDYESIIIASMYCKATNRTYLIGSLIDNPAKYQIYLEFGGAQYKYGANCDFKYVADFMADFMERNHWAEYNISDRGVN